jgi:hypothetical protein
MRTISRRLAVSRGRAALFWMLGLFAAGQAVFGVWLLRSHPEMCNPTWNFRRDRLRDQLAAAPGRPLVIFLGSSRAANGISPADFGEWQPRNGPAPVPFNFATLGAGPIRELLTLRRLLADGVHPDWLVVEVWPAFWRDEGFFEERFPIALGDGQLSDVPVLQHVYGQGWEVFVKTVETNLVPIVHFRTEVFDAWAPFLVSRQTRDEVVKAQAHWCTLDPWGWLPLRWGGIDDAVFAHNIEVARGFTLPALKSLMLTPNADWAIRELLGECRAHHIQVAFLYLPEHSILRSWYPPEKLSLVQDYLERLRREYGMPIIDLRDWVSDDCFQDVLHLHQKGARIFSHRFGGEVLRPLLEGAPLPPQVTLHLDGSRESPGGALPTAGSVAVPGALDWHSDLFRPRDQGPPRRLRQGP